MMDKRNKKQKHLWWTDDQRRLLLKNHKTMSVQELSVLIGKPEQSIINQCGHMGCSYYNEKKTHSRTDIIGQNGNDGLHYD